MFKDLSIIVYWWLLISSIGLIFLPLTNHVFKSFKDRGYGLSKILGIILITWTSWLFASLKLVPFGIWSLYGVVVCFWLINLWLLRHQKKAWLKSLKANWRVWLIQEWLCLSTLIFFSSIRTYQPDIIGLEKYMDFGFVNSILKSRFFPPKDMWWQGGTINYYYFGHLITAVLTKISGLSSSLSYNLMIATLFSLSFSASLSIAGNLWQKAKVKLNSFGFIAGGLLSSLAINLMANLHPLIYIWRGIDKYWYPDATRFIPRTIHEFPFYTFVVADLHGHLNNLPNSILSLALILSLINQGSILNLVLLGLSLAVGYMTNAWDLIIYLALAGWLLLIQRGFKTALTKTILLAGLIIVFSLPFQLEFDSFAQGVGWAQEHSEIWRLLVLWGFQLFFSLLWLILMTFKTRWQKINSQEKLILGLMIFSWGLVIAPEFVYLKDIYATHPRANTMFKLAFAAWVIFGINLSLVVNWLTTNIKSKLRFVYIGLIGLIMMGCLTYPIWAIRSYYNGLKNYQGLNGTNYLARRQPDDWQAIQWLNTLDGQPVILEAVGESYTDYARVSVHTGLPTVVGWRVHEWLWRGSFDPVGRRTEEVKQIYQSTDIKLTQQLLNQYQVEYIFVGSLERQTYPELQEEKLAGLSQKIFSQGQTFIYQLKTD